MEVDDVGESSLIPSIVFSNGESLETVDDGFPDESLFSVYNPESIRIAGKNDSIFSQVEEENEDPVSSPEEIVEVPEDDFRPRFVLNLYGPEEGYSYGMVDPQMGETPESHLLPYSEKYIIDCIDSGTIPWKVVALLKEESDLDLISCEGTMLAEVRDYRHFSTVSLNTAKIRHVLLRPTNQSLLSDLDTIVEEGYREKLTFDLENESEDDAEDSSDESTNERSSDIENSSNQSLPSSSDSKCSSLPSTSSSCVEDEEETFCIDIKEEPIVDDEGSSIDEESSFVDDQDASVGDISEDDEQEVERTPEPAFIKQEPIDPPATMNHVVSPIKIENVSFPQQQFTLSMVKQEAPSTAHMEYNSPIFDGEMSSTRSNSYNKSDVDCDYSSKHFLPVNCRIVKQGVIDSSSINDKDMVTNLSSQNLSEPYGNGMCKIYVCSPCNSNEKATDLSRYSSENQTLNGKAVIIPEENSNNFVGCYTMKIDEYEENGDSNFTNFEILNEMEMNEARNGNNCDEIVKNGISVQEKGEEMYIPREENLVTVKSENRVNEIEYFSPKEIKTEYEPMEINGEHDFTSFDPFTQTENVNSTEIVDNCTDFQEETTKSDDDNENDENDVHEEESDDFSHNEVKTDDSNSEQESDNDSIYGSEDGNEGLNFTFFHTKCDHKYDRQHYSVKRESSSKEINGEIDTSSQSEESSSESISSDSSNSSQSEEISNSSESDIEIDENEGEGGVRTERLIENEIESESGSESGSKSSSESSDSETEYFDESRHTYLPEDNTIEDDSYIITDVDPFSPEDIQSENSESESQPISGKLQFVSTEEFDEDEFVGYELPENEDHYISSEIISETLIPDEKHPNGLVKEHQLALSGTELSGDENDVFDDDSSEYDSDEIELELNQEIPEEEYEEIIFENPDEEVAENSGNDLDNQQEFQENLQMIKFEESQSDENDMSIEENSTPSDENNIYAENMSPDENIMPPDETNMSPDENNMSLVIWKPGNEGNIDDNAFQVEETQHEDLAESDDNSESVGYCVTDFQENQNVNEFLLLGEEKEANSNSELSEEEVKESLSSEESLESEDSEGCDESEDEDEQPMVMIHGEDGQVYTDSLENFNEDEQQAILDSLRGFYLVGDDDTLIDFEISEDKQEEQYYDVEKELPQQSLISTEKEQIAESCEADPHSETTEGRELTLIGSENVLPQKSTEKFDEDENSEDDEETVEDLITRILEMPDDESESEVGLNNDDETTNLDDGEKGIVTDTLEGILDGSHFDVLAEEIKKAIDEVVVESSSEDESEADDPQDSDSMEEEFENSPLGSESPVYENQVVEKMEVDEPDEPNDDENNSYQLMLRAPEESSPNSEIIEKQYQDLLLSQGDLENDGGEVFRDFEGEDIEETLQNAEESNNAADSEDSELSDNEEVSEMKEILSELYPTEESDGESSDSSENENMTTEEIDKILNSEECDDVLHAITSDILLKAATDDYLVKSLQLSFANEMNRFIQNAYDEYEENPLANKYVNMTREELAREIDLELAADELCTDPNYDPTSLNSLDARLEGPGGEANEEVFKKLDGKLFTDAELKDFMQCKFPLEEFCENEEEDDEIDEEENGFGVSEESEIDEAYLEYLDDNYFTGEAVLTNLEQQLEECLQGDSDDIGDSSEEEEEEEEIEESIEDEQEFELENLEEVSNSVEMTDDTELSYDQRLNLEETLINETSGKICIDPSPLVGVLSNRLQFEKLKWNAPAIKNSWRNWVAPEPPMENHFSRVFKENPSNELAKAHLKRKRSSTLRKPKPLESVPNRNVRGFKRPRALLEPRELTLSKLLRSDMDNDIITPPPVPEEEEDSFYDCPETFHRFFEFVIDCKTRRAKPSDKDERQLSYVEQLADPETRRQMLTLEPSQIVDFMDVDPPSNTEALKKIFKIPEPAMIQSFPIENTCRVIEEYLLETDRRKKPHYTKVTIYQRNYLENYHGEVLMESLFEPTAPSPLGKFPKIPPYTTCEFGLGCSTDVALYIKQFLDIFSEDGKRACKVTCHKVGQPFPFVVATPYYKPIFPEPPIPKEFQFTIGPSTVNPYPTYMERNIKFPTQGFTQNLTHLYYPGGPGHGSQHSHYVNQLLSLSQNNNYSQSNSNNYGFLGHSLYNTTSNVSSSSSSSSSSSTSTSQPPVQIVHPQPRPVQQQTQQIISSSAAAASLSSGHIYAASSNNNPVLSQTIQQPSANVNFNVNVNSSGIVGISPQQVLTRPHIVNVNVQQQPQQQTIQTRAVNVPTQQQLQQLAQQRSLRMRQQQQQLQKQQYIQQHPTALAKLLTSNIQGHIGSGANKPITVAVPPQPQNPNKNTNNPPQSPSENLTMSIGSPIEHHAIQHHPPTVSPSPNVNVNVNTSPNVNVNLNTISLDGLLSGNPTGMNFATSTSNIVTSNVSVVGNNRIVTGTSISPATALNILRLNTGGTTNLINANSLQRGLTVSNLNSNNVSIMSQPQQRILVNSAGNVVATQNQHQLGDLEEISVTDLNSFLNSQQIQICQLGVGQQVALSQNHPQLQQQLQLQQTAIPQQHIQTLDSHNVNLNLNVNLNSGNSESSQQIAKIQSGDWTTSTNSNAPFVVFISPLTRPLNSDNSGQTSRNAGPSSTVNVNLAAIQTSPHFSQPQTQTIVLEAAPSVNKPQNHQQYDGQNLIPQEIVGVTPEGVAVDTLFNALSDAIGPELGKKLDVIGSVVGHNTVVVSSTVNVPISSPVIQSRISPQSHLSTYNLINMQSSSSASPHAAKFTSHVAPSKQNTNVITLNDLLASPTIVSSSTGGNYSGSGSFVLSSNNSGNSNLANAGALLSPISKPTPSPGPSGLSNVASSTPRLSALLAGSPSADSMISGNNSLSIMSDGSLHGTGGNNNSLLANAIDASHTTASYGNLLDRLAASLSQPPGTASQIRTGVSRLNPIASATPNVVLEHPMLAASLTQQSTPPQPSNRATAYRQIAPAPPPNLVQHAHAQPQQLINLLGLNPSGQPRTIRINATTPVTGKPSPSSGNMGAGR